MVCKENKFLPREFVRTYTLNENSRQIKKPFYCRVFPCLSVCFRGHYDLFSLLTSHFLSLPLHRFEKLGVALGGLQLVEQKFHGGQFVHGVQELAQYPHLLQFGGVGQQFFATGA
jgi:hypothetical protein